MTFGDMAVSHYFWALAEGLARRGHLVTVLVGDQRTDVVKPDSNPALLTWPSARPTTWKDAKFLHRIIKERHITVLVGNFAATNLTMLLGIILRVPTRAAWYHTLSTQAAVDETRPAWHRMLLHIRKAFVYHLATHVVGVSESARRDAVKIYRLAPARTLALHPLIPDPHAGRVPRGGRGAKVLCVGRFHPSKGQEYLIRAIPSVLEICEEADFCFVGQGPTESRLKALAEELGVGERCCFTGQLGRKKVLGYMRMAAVSVCPSRSEAFGLVNVESMAAGTPIIASDVPGPDEIVRDGVDGFLVPPEDPVSLSDKLGLLLRDPDLRHRLGQNARSRFLENFSISSIAEHIDCLESWGE